MPFKNLLAVVKKSRPQILIGRGTDHLDIEFSPISRPAKLLSTTHQWQIDKDGKSYFLQNVDIDGYTKIYADGTIVYHDEDGGVFGTTKNHKRKLLLINKK